ncbi:MAG TPA: DUF4097 family beta strand repeat-containing protein [Myxococcales bacterium]|jgi:hypothetical protein
MKLKTLAVGLAAVLLAACGGGGGDPGTQSTKLNAEQKVAVTSAAKKLTLNNSFGAIKVIGESGRTEILMKPTLKTGTAEDGDIKVAESGDTVAVQVNKSASGDIAVDIVVYTPEALEFTVNTSGGALDLTGMKGSGTANTGDGSCTVNMDLGTNGTLTLNTAKGDIGVTVSATTKGTLTVQATNGTFTVDQDLEFSGSVLGGMGTGNINGGGDATITLNTSEGNVSVSEK